VSTYHADESTLPLIGYLNSLRLSNPVQCNVALLRRLCWIRRCPTSSTDECKKSSNWLMTVSPACRSISKSYSFLTCAKAVTNLFIDAGEILGVAVARTSSVPYRESQHRQSWCPWCCGARRRVGSTSSYGSQSCPLKGLPGPSASFAVEARALLLETLQFQNRSSCFSKFNSGSFKRTSNWIRECESLACVSHSLCSRLCGD